MKQVFNDFPAEIFIQRSQILKLLTDTLISKYDQLNHEEIVDLIKSCLNCFRFFCVKLIKRIKYVKDPATFCCFSNSENEKDAFESSLFEELSRSIYTSYINGSRLSAITLLNDNSHMFLGFETGDVYGIQLIITDTHHCNS